MTSLKQRISSVLFFTNTEDALSSERARNEEARAMLSRERLKNNDADRQADIIIGELDQQIKAKRDAYATKAKPLLKEFDDIALSQHYYQEVSNIATGQEQMIQHMAQRELGEFGYMSKKLISVSLNFEALRNKIASGSPFKAELSTTLADADDKDAEAIASPLLALAESGIPSLPTLRATAFDLARAIEETGKLPQQEPTRGWLDFFKFRTSFSPTTLEVNQAHARRQAAVFTEHIEMGEYHKALELATQMHATVESSHDATYNFFDASYKSFRRAVVPAIASEVFMMYGKSFMNASRYAYVEKMLSE